MPTVYAHVVRYDSTGEYAVQYWLLYLLNYRLNVHESDWEQITVRLDPSKRPLGAFYSSYGTGIQKDWHDVEREREHPVAYVALGSHANYFEAGWHAVHLDCPPSYRSLRICVRGRIIRDLADGRAPLRPQEYEVTELSAPVFVGSYGDVNYIAGRRQQTNIADPRLRLSWRNALKSEIVAEKHPIDVRSH